MHSVVVRVTDEVCYDFQRHGIRSTRSIRINAHFEHTCRIHEVYKSY